MHCLQKEIEVLINEIFLPILEMRNSTVRQKSVLLTTLCKLCEDPQTLVDIYINYDCDRSSIENVYERMISSISRIGTTSYTTVTPAQPSSGNLSGPGDIVNASAGSGVQIGLGSQEKDPFGNMPYEQRLKRQSLDALVNTLRSLVSWAGKGTTSGPSGSVNSVVSPPAIHTSTSDLNAASQEDVNQSSDDIRPPLNRASISESDLQRPGSSASGYQTPDYRDDPERFETAKQRKTTLIEGIKRFNAKPKKVGFLLLSLLVSTADRYDTNRESPSSCNMASFLLALMKTSPHSLCKAMALVKLLLANISVARTFCLLLRAQLRLYHD